MRSLEFLFVIAFALYTFVIWYHFMTGRLDVWMVWLFGAGLSADIGGTLFLCVVAAASWTWTLHTISGLASLVIMAVHFMWAVGAAREEIWKFYFDRFSLYAWCLWMVAFISGIPR